MAAICLDNSLSGCIKNPRTFIPLTMLLLCEKISSESWLTPPILYAYRQRMGIGQGIRRMLPTACSPSAARTHWSDSGAGAGLQKEGVCTHSSGAGLAQNLGMCPGIPQVTSMCPEFSKAW